jgi:hypothetical protein
MKIMLQSESDETPELTLVPQGDGLEMKRQDLHSNLRLLVSHPVNSEELGTI